jgi:hypothetical protein
MTYRRLLARTLPGAGARALAPHLDHPCETCERLLAGRAGADRYDGLVDAVLLRLAPPGPGGGNDLELARIERRLRAARASPRRTASRPDPADVEGRAPVTEGTP